MLVFNLQINEFETEISQKITTQRYFKIVFKMYDKSNLVNTMTFTNEILASKLDQNLVNTVCLVKKIIGTFSRNESHLWRIYIKEKMLDFVDIVDY